MDSAQIIFKYFPNISEKQKQQFCFMGKLYAEWNLKINVISRKDIENFYERHVLHSLGIAKAIAFKPKTKILDVGTGGGFPGIPLAILFPECEFHLVDSIGKKIKVVNAVVEALELKNVKGIRKRAEEINEKYHFFIGRAVTDIDKFRKWIKGKFMNESFNELKNGVLYLRGEADGHQHYELKTFFSENFFETKKVVYIPAH